MIEEPLFSIILLHYNQASYVETALKSIFEQTYNNIEIIFADDCSTNINLENLKKFSDKNKKSNIKKIIWQINEQNVGTVKSLNKAVDKCSGKYILFFAADDALYDENVIQNFKNAFDRTNDNVYMISSQCYMMDKTLKVCLNEFVDDNEADEFNKMDSFEQYKVFAQKCFLAIGSTAMKRSMFEKFGKFNEEYKFIEDWSYFLILTRNGGRMEYSDFKGLLHRSGGVSHYEEKDKLPKHVIAYRYDLIRIMENEIFPYVNEFSVEEKIQILQNYKRYKEDYNITEEGKSTYSYLKLYKYFKTVLFKKTVRKFADRIKIYVRTFPRKFMKILTLWAILCVLSEHFNKLPIVNNILEFTVDYICFGVFVFFLLQYVFIWLTLGSIKVKIFINRLFQKTKR